MPSNFALRDTTNQVQPIGTHWGARKPQETTYQTPNRTRQAYRPASGPAFGGTPQFGRNIGSPYQSDNGTPNSTAREAAFGFSSQRRATPNSSFNSNSSFKSFGVTPSPQRPLFKKYLLRELEPQEKAPLVTVVFDLDETLVSNRRADLPKALLRAYCIDALRAIRNIEGIEIVLWTASTEETGGPVVEQLEEEFKVFDQVIFRSDEWFTEPMHTKDLRLLGRSMDRVIVFDNAPNCVKLNRFNAILVDDYHGGENPHDETLANICKMITILRDGVKSNRTVPDMLRGFATDRSAGVYTVQYQLPEAWRNTDTRNMSPVMVPAQGKFFKVTQEHLQDY